jgi:hypothetical protein
MKNLAKNIFEPTRLLWVGLTNNPNIKTCELAKEVEQKNFQLPDGEKFARVMNLLGLDELLEFEEQMVRLQSILDDSQKWRAYGEELIDENKKLRVEAENFYDIIRGDEPEKILPPAPDDNLIDDACQVGPDAQDAGVYYANDSFFTNLNTRAKTDGLNARTRCFDEKKEKIITLVQERMVATGDNYGNA